MDRFECEEIIGNINAEALSAKKVYIFGLNKYCAFIIEQLRKRHIEVRGILDNNISKQGKMFEQVLVESPETCLAEYDDEVCVLIASRYYHDMSRQIRSYGYGDKHICKLLELWQNGHLNHAAFVEYLMLPHQGEEIINNIRIKYGKEAWILYAPVISVGDVYLMSMYVQAFLESQNKKYIFLLTGNAAAGLAASMGLKDVEVVSKKESFMITNFLMLNGFENNHVVFLHTGYVHTSICERLLTYKGCSWLDNYRIIFGLKRGTSIRIPSFAYDEKVLEHILQENGLKDKNAVMLAPYTNTVWEIEKEFWVKLSERLAATGFQVFTNVVGAEEPVPKTKPITFSLEYAEALMGKISGFVGLRSGLCDVICNSDCKKVILYPDVTYDFVSVYDYYSFAKMGIGKNIEEIVFDYDNVGEKLIGDIINCLKGRKGNG